MNPSERLNADTVAVREAIAREFHWYYESLAARHGYETRPETAKPWDEVPEANRGLMIAVVGALLDNGFIRPGTALIDGDQRG